MDTKEGKETMKAWGYGFSGGGTSKRTKKKMKNPLDVYDNDDNTFEGAPFTKGGSFFFELFYIVGISVGLGVLLAMCS